MDYRSAHCHVTISIHFVVNRIDIINGSLCVCCLSILEGGSKPRHEMQGLLLEHIVGLFRIGRVAFSA